MLLEAIDKSIKENAGDHELFTALVLNRNRVAKFLGLPTAKFWRAT